MRARISPDVLAKLLDVSPARYCLLEGGAIVPDDDLESRLESAFFLVAPASLLLSPWTGSAKLLTNLDAGFRDRMQGVLAIQRRLAS